MLAMLRGVVRFRNISSRALFEYVDISVCIDTHYKDKTDPWPFCGPAEK